jgi:hypothetical protein
VRTAPVLGRAPWTEKMENVMIVFLVHEAQHKSDLSRATAAKV